jgi:hypothetical protein
MSSANRAERQASARLLIAAAHPDPHEFARALERERGALDWPWLVERASRHKVAALLARRVDEAGSRVSAPAPVLHELDRVRAGAATRAAQCQRTLQAVAEAFRAAGTPFLLVKGAVLAEHVYRDPAIRPFHDIDILVHVDDIDAGARALQSLGFHAHRVRVRFLRRHGIATRGRPNDRVDAATTRDVYKRVHFHWAFPPPEGLVPVEMHWHLGAPGYFRVDGEAFWRSTRTLKVAGCDVETLGVHETVVHLATHALLDFPYLFRVLHLADMAWAIDRWSTDIDPARLLDTAETWGTAADLAVAITLIREFLGVAGVPPFAPSLSAWQRFCLDRAADAWSLVDLSRPLEEFTKVGEGYRRQVFWHLARRRWPFPGVRHAAVSVAGRLAILRHRHDTSDSSARGGRSA